jgi:hypothetical protein
VIRLVQNEVNRGTNYTANRGLNLATGELIYFASSNDEALQGLFEKTAQIMTKYPQAGLCCTDMHFVNMIDGSQYRNPPGWLSQAGYLSPTAYAEATRRSNVSHPLTQSTIVRRELLPKSLGYMSQLEWYADWFLIQIIALRYGCCYIPEPLALFRWFNRGYFFNGINNRSYYKEVFFRIIRLLVSPEYADVAPLMARGRSLQFILLHARSPIAVWRAIHSVKERNRYADTIFWYLTVEYLCETLGPNALCAVWQKNLVKPAKDVVHETQGLSKNLYDRIYARLFHEYDRTRSFIKKIGAK